MPSPKSGTKVPSADPKEPKPATVGTGGKTSTVKAKSTSAKSEKPGSTEVGKINPQQAKKSGGTEESKPEEKKPTIAAKWSKSEVTPDHNGAFPPATPPTDTVPEECKAKMLVTTTEVPDGTPATINVHHHGGARVGTIDKLEVKGGKVVVKATGEEPEWVFEARHQPWKTYATPFFYFHVTVSFKGLQATTPKDPKKQEAECLRAIYWHTCVADLRADANDGLTTGAEMVEIAGIMVKNKHHKVLQQGFNQRTVAVNLWGSVMRNSYAYHQASHGDIVDRTTGAQLNPGNKNPPTNKVGNWRSVVCLGNTNLGDAELSQKANVPSAPCYLAYLDTCVAGWEPSFANAFLNRGTRNVIAFRMYIPDNAARRMARDFYKKWCGTHKCNPDKIPAVFFEVGAPYYGSMRPVLFGQGGGAIKSPAMQAAEAVAKAISNAVKSITDLLK